MTKEQILEWLDKNNRGFTQKDFELFKKFHEEATKELQEEITGLKGEANSVLDNWCRGDDPCPHLKKRDDQLTKAKFLLKQLVDAFPKSYSDVVKDTLDEARKFVEE